MSREPDRRRRLSPHGVVFRAGAALVCAVALATLPGCLFSMELARSTTQDDEAATPTQDRPPQRAGLEVRRGSFQARYLLTGELQAIEAAPLIVPRTPNWQMPIRWMERDGAFVKRGQKLLELDNTQFSNDLEGKRLAADRALNELLQAQANIATQLADRQFSLEQARIVLEKAKLRAAVPEELRSRREHQESQLELARAELNLAKAQEDLRSAEEAADAELEVLRIDMERARRELRTAEQAIKQLTLHAPRDGILVVSRHPREGRKLQIGDNVWVGLTVMTIPELSAMKVVTRLSDVDEGNVTVGMRAVCTLDAYPDREFEGRVVDLSPVATEEGRNSLRRGFRLEIHLDASDPERMRPGMSVKVAVLPPPRPAELMLPRVALDLGSDPPRVLLADGSAAEVQIDSCNALECIVLEGLDEGARLRRRG